MTCTPGTHHCYYCENTNSSTLNFRSEITLISANFMRNEHHDFHLQGTIFLFKVENIIVQNVNITGSEYAISLYKSIVEFEGANLFSDNYQAFYISYCTVIFNGNVSSRSYGIATDGSSISFRGYTLFYNNGTIKSYDGSQISFTGYTVFHNNSGVLLVPMMDYYHSMEPQYSPTTQP